MPRLTRACAEFWSLPGFSVRDHACAVPLDWVRAWGEMIALFASEVTAPGRERDDLPVLVSL